MSDEIRSIRIKSNNICYGPEPGADDEVEQYLSISSTGRVWFLHEIISSIAMVRTIAVRNR